MGTLEMSMPQSLKVAVIGESEERLIEIQNSLNLPSEGRCPRYCFATPQDDIEKLVNPRNLPYAHVDLWISLDLPSNEFCQMKHSENMKDPKYNRGYYDKILPNAVIDVKDNQYAIETLKKHTEEIMKAFCESS